MKSATKAKQADRPSRLLTALHGQLVSYMARAGLITFLDAPGGTDSGAPAPAPAPAAPAPAPIDSSAAPAPAPSAAPAAPAPSAAPAAPAPSPAPSPAPAAPEAYADFALPEGVAVNAERMGEFKSLAKELNLTQDAAQKLVDMNARAEVARATQVQDTLKAWGEAAKADKEIGGDKFAENMAVVAKARDTFASPELKQFLDQTKLGDHPEMLRAFYRIGQRLSEDSFVQGRGGSNSTASVAQRMYPNMNP